MTVRRSPGSIDPAAAIMPSAVPADLPPIVAFEGLDGAGKSTLLRTVAAALSGTRRVLCTKLAYDMVSIFQELVDRPADRDGGYHEVVPPDFRHGAYIVEAALQFRRDQWRYRTFDLVLFDRWLHTHHAYLERPEPWRWYEVIEGACVPRPDLTVYVRVTPDVAIRRLVEDGDWMVDFYGLPALRQRILSVYERYEQFEFSPGLIVDGEQSPAQLSEQVIAAIAASSRP